MTYAIVEHQNGKKAHHTNVMRCAVGSRRGRIYVRLLLSDGSEQVIDGAVAGRLVADDWYVAHASGLVPA